MTGSTGPRERSARSAVLSRTDPQRAGRLNLKGSGRRGGPGGSRDLDVDLSISAKIQKQTISRAGGRAGGRARLTADSEVRLPALPPALPADREAGDRMRADHSLAPPSLATRHEVPAGRAGARTRCGS